MQNTPSKCLEDMGNLKQEFVPFFLNYLRDLTIHLVQNNKSATPSPAKTPSLKKLQKSVKKGCETNRKRQQLFGASPAADDDLRNLPSSVFSPNTSLESPGVVHTSKGDRHSSRGLGNFYGQKYSPQCGSQRGSHNQQTPDQRSRHKLSLGEFLVTPEQNNNASSNWKKKSPHSGGKKELSIDNSYSHGRKSGGKKRHSYSPLVQNSAVDNVSNNCSSDTSHVFSLTSSSDFPPMGSNKPSRSNKPNRRSLDSNFGPSISNTCDTSKTSRVINFSNTCDNSAVTKYAQERLKDVKRTSPVTVQTSTPNVRRITPTVVKVESSVQQNSAFLVPIDEVEPKVNKADSVKKSSLTKQSKVDPLLEEREHLK